MGRIIDFKTGKDITDTYNNLEEIQLSYDNQDLFNSQIITLVNALLFCMNVEDDIARQDLIDAVNSAYKTAEQIIKDKNKLL